MDWNGNYRNFVISPNPSFSYLYDFNSCSVSEMKHTSMEDVSYGMVPVMGKKKYGSDQEKKKRLTSEQLGILERSFQEDIKLDPDRKIKLSRELGLQPRQIVIWFQNRRARSKTKQLEHLYDALKQEFDVISREKEKLQEEVLKLKAILRYGTSRKKISDGCTMIYGEEMVESMLDGALSSEKTRGVNRQHEMVECSYLSNVDESPPLWSSLCSYLE